jgi:S1-C subfamily serine protease
MKRFTRLAGATAVVAVSMALGAVLALGYAWFLGPGSLLDVSRAGEAGGVGAAVRVEAPLSRRGDSTKADLFDEAQVARLYERAAPAVVAIYSAGDQRGGAGSGVIVDPAGVVLTNYHVVRGATRIEVALSDRARYNGEVLGSDPQNDLAVVRLVDAPSGLPALTLGDTAAVRPGSLAVAIGNPLGYERSVTVGVVSGLNRTLRERDRPPLRNAIQTDAAINQGNSGGPLLDARGRVLGINAQIRSTSGGGVGVGFAIPVDTVRRSLDQLRREGEVSYAFLGVSSQDLYPQLAEHLGVDAREGALVVDVAEGSPAQEAGLEPGEGKTEFQGQPDIPEGGDVIVAVEGQPVDRGSTLADLIERRPAGSEVQLEVVRGDDRREVTVTLDERPATAPPE